jgi:lipopolysaccharide transport system permease protein/teichoic acid transport system permease protein
MLKLLADGKDFLNHLVTHYDLIAGLTRRDFTSRFIKNYFGLLWAIIDPVAFIVILYFVFGMRFGNQQILGVPYIMYLIPAYISYSFFSDAIRNTSEGITSYSFLITKVNFRLAILPLVKLISNLALHLIILAVAFILLIINGIYPTVYWFQLIYYILVLCLLLAGLSWATSAISLFFPDIKNIISIATRLLFFVTPIFWNQQGLPENYLMILKLNPLFYIAEGYRESLLYGTGFWKHPVQTIYVWGLILVVNAAGSIIFRKLRPHFADVLS